MRQQILRLLQEVDKEICEGGEVRFRSISGFMHSNWISMLPGLTQSQFCWKDFVKLRQKKILFLTPSSIQVGCKMAGFTLGSSRQSFHLTNVSPLPGIHFNLIACTECGEFIVFSFNFPAMKGCWIFVHQGGEVIAHVLQGGGERIPRELDGQLEDRVTQGWYIVPHFLFVSTTLKTVKSCVKSLEDISTLQDPNQVLILSTRNSQVKPVKNHGKITF